MKNPDDQRKEEKQYPNSVARVLDRLRSGEGMSNWAIEDPIPISIPIPASAAERRAQERVRILSAGFPIRFEDE